MGAERAERSETCFPSEAAQRAVEPRDRLLLSGQQNRSLHCASLRSAPVGMTGVAIALRLLNAVSIFLVGFVLENGFLRLQQLDHLAEFFRPYVT